ncbi:MAG: FdhF/YdeP family oxidoreductase [Longimicrobiales bacterium]|nr:FdhF/YdeP family oxidoreductase [Longimicrobiales bacterium]
MEFGFNPGMWVSPVPFGLGKEKPKHFRDMARVWWENRDQLEYATRILKEGVCDGCALGTTGIRDFTLDGVHLCTIRLELLRLNTMGPLNPALLDDVSELEGLSGDELRELGRIPHPMVRRKGDPGFSRISWDGALDLLADRIRGIDPKRWAIYLTSRGITNEVYYATQKVARFLGTNNVDNSARICHAPSTTALKRSIGYAASTCSYSDWIGTDLLVFIGSHVANNQPVATKYMYRAKEEGTRIAMVNSFREPAMERYWIPSILDSAVFGSKLTDDFFQVHQGGDVAFLNGVLKHLVERDALAHDFIRERTVGFEALAAEVRAQTWDDLERFSGVSKEEMGRFADMVAEAENAVFVWSMGITQHRFGVDNVQAIVNLGLARGYLGREKCGLMPIRGHSGVQGGAEVGAVPWSFPGGRPVGSPGAAAMSELWGFDVPDWRGLSAVEVVHAAHRGEMDLLWAIGGDYLGTLPDPAYCREALERVPLRVHQDIVLAHQMFVEPDDTVLLLPATTRYEQPGGGTETATERRIYFSPEIPGPRIPEARSEWEVFVDLAHRVDPERAAGVGGVGGTDKGGRGIGMESAQAIREDIAAAVPFYDGIQRLRGAGDAVQWGGPRLCADGRTALPDGKAHFHTVAPPELDIPEGHFHLSTRRGKQFNSMVQAEKDPLTGGVRDHVFMAPADARRLGLSEGDPVTLVSEVGTFHGRCRPSDMKERNLQLFWPEANPLIRRGVVEPQCGIPDFTAVVRVEPGHTGGDAEEVAEVAGGGAAAGAGAGTAGD